MTRISTRERRWRAANLSQDGIRAMQIVHGVEIIKHDKPVEANAWRYTSDLADASMCRMLSLQRMRVFGVSPDKFWRMKGPSTLGIPSSQAKFTSPYGHTRGRLLESCEVLSLRIQFII